MKFMYVLYALCGLFMLLSLVWIVMMLLAPGFGPGMQDFEIDIVNGWILTRTSGDMEEVHSTRLGRSWVYSDDGTLLSSTPAIPPKVVEIVWDKRFIIARQQNLIYKLSKKPYNEYDAAKKIPPNTAYYDYPIPDKTSSNYWIIDASIDKVYGPFDKSEFAKQRVALSVPDTLILKSVNSYKKKY